MALEEELLKQGFEKIGPMTAIGLGERLDKFLSENKKHPKKLDIHSVYQKGSDPYLFMIYYRCSPSSN